MKNNITQFDKCANCGMCLNICPQNAIYIKTDEYFYKYKVDDFKCVNCGMWVKKCPLHNKTTFLNIKGAYGGWHKDAQIVKASSSGGAFSAIANYVLSKGGVVYGASFSDDSKSVITRSTDEVSLDELRRSKYVESYVGLSFRSIKAELEKGKWVCFCGTPCQVAGLISYLPKKYDRLVTIDFACGGLTSHLIYQNYCTYLEKKYKSKIKSVNFRSGVYGWKRHCLRNSFENKKKYTCLSEFDPYIYTFMYSRYGNRSNCFACSFRDSHFSDFIIADFWRFKEYSFLDNNETGISLILTNSNLAEDILKDIKNNMHLTEVDLNQGMYNCFVKPPVTDVFLNSREAFFHTYETKGLRCAAIQSGMKHGLAKLLRIFMAKKYKKE